MRIKSRIKRIAKKNLPQPLKNFLKGLLKFSHTILYKRKGSYFYKPGIKKKAALKKITIFKEIPLISILMPVYNAEVKWLEAAIKSVENQYYTNWELCIVDDFSSDQATLSFLKDIENPKIKIIFLTEKGNFSKAGNEGLKLAHGEFVAFLGNNDLLTEDALFEIVNCINEQNADIIYSDEDKIVDNKKYSFPHYKPDFSPDLLTSQYYICNFLLIRKSLIDQVGGFEIGIEEFQEYDLFLKCSEKTTKVHHISKVLYHQRITFGDKTEETGPKNHAPGVAKKILDNYIKRNNIKGIVQNGMLADTYRIKREIIGNPLISIIIPFNDKPELLRTCIESILYKSTYTNFEIIGISNNSKKQETTYLLKEFEKLDSRIKFYEYNIPFNFSKINNYAARIAKGEQLVLLNNDIEIISNDWIETLLEHSQRAEIGAVGAKLYYPDSTIQHAGVIIGIVGVAGHSHKHFSRTHQGYFGRLQVVQNFSAVTGACLMVKKKIYEQMEGLDENNLSIAYNDIDFCLRLRENGYLNIFTPYCEAYHHESISRGSDNRPEMIERFTKEMNYMRHRHRKIFLTGDPYYNTNLTDLLEDFSINPK